MPQEFLRSLISTTAFYCIQLQKISQTPGNDRKSSQSFIVIQHCIYFSPFLCIMTTGITEGYEVWALLVPQSDESSHESLLPR